MSEPRAPSVVRLVLVPAILSVIVVAVRLYGERHEWSPTLFAKTQGGGSPIGITWLVPVFGSWFGLRLSRAGHGPASGWRALGWAGLGIALLVGGSIAAWSIVIEHLPHSTHWMAAGAWLLTLLAWQAWPRLFLTNLLYGVLARLPVIGVTWVACQRDWDVHFAKLGAAFPPVSDWQAKAYWLSLAQVGLWIPFTILAGGVFGALAALVLGRKR